MARFPAVALGAVVPVVVFAAFGFRLWEAYPVLHDRYWAGIAAGRPAAYWWWGDLAALAIAAGPALGAGLGSLVVRRAEVTTAWCACSWAPLRLAVVVADASADEQGRGRADLASFRAVAAALRPPACPSGGGGRCWACRSSWRCVVQHLVLTNW